MSGIMSLPRVLLQPSTGHYRAPQPRTSGPPASRRDPQASPLFACGDHVHDQDQPLSALSALKGAVQPLLSGEEMRRLRQEPPSFHPTPD